MSIANISSPEDSYGRHGNLLPPVRQTPTINQNVQQGDISFGNYMNQNGDMNLHQGEIENCCMPRSLMLSAGIGENSLMLSAGIGENSLMLSAGIGENYLMPSAGIGMNSLMPMSSAGIGENSLMPMPSAGIGENSLMPNVSMNSQEEEFSGDLGFQPSTSFENPDPPMMRMSYPEYIHKVSGDSSQHERVTPTNDQNFQDGENEQLLNHNQINYSMLCIGQKRRFKKLDTEEQCNSEQSPMRKNKKFTREELVKTKTGHEIRLLYRHRVDRQIAQDKETDMKSVLVKPWPVQPDIQSIQQEFQEIANANLEPEADKEKSLEVASKFDKLQQQRKGPSTTAGKRGLSDFIVNNLDLHFQTGFVEALKKKFSARSPSLLSAFSELKHIVYDKGNNKVGKESFPGLQEELQKIGWEEVPSFLQSIANRIEKDRGIVTEFTYKPTQILVCAAIQEMENFPVEKLDFDTLKKWGATINKAKELGFQVGFADDLLKKNFFAYLAYTQVLG